MVRVALHQSLLVFFVASCGPNGNIDGGSAIGKKQDGDQRNTSDQTAIPDPAKPTSETSFDLTGCGYSLSPPTAVLNSQQLTMVPATVSTTVQLILFQSKKDVAINGNFVMESSLARQAISYKATPVSNADAAEVVSFVKGATGSGEATLLDLDQRGKIGTISPDWAGLFCVLQPAAKIQHNAVQNVTAEFSQPIPFGVLVNGDAARLKAELAGKRTWSNVVAKITDSNNPTAPVGSAMTGNVSMEPVSVAGNGDIAVKITYDFGSADKNQLLGLPSNIIWYIDSAAHKIKAVQVDVVGGKPNLFK